MTARGTTLHGDWTGVYDYGDNGDDASADPVPFTASLFDIAGAVWGTTREPNTFAPDAGDELHASVNGTRSGREVRFRKTYRGRPKGGEVPIDYAGHVMRDGNRIEGRWQLAIPGRMIAGSFVMNRKPGVAAVATRVETAEDEISV